MVDPAGRCHGAGMHTTEDSIRVIEAARTVEVVAFSPDGDPLAYVAISKSEALALVASPVAMGHRFRAVLATAGRVFVEAVDVGVLWSLRYTKTNLGADSGAFGVGRFVSGGSSIIT